MSADEKGFIGLHAHGNYGAKVYSRNMRVKELKWKPHPLHRNLCHAAIITLAAVSAPGVERVQQRPDWQRNRAALDRCFVLKEFAGLKAVAGFHAF
ncbi:MAG: hypothetical protein WA117_11975 [Verrucomicrobiia bacterium]